MRTKYFKIITRAVILTFGIIFLLLPSFAIKSKDGKWEYSTNRDKTIGIMKYYGKDTKLIIPEKIDGITVTAINNEAFTSSNLVSISMPNSITFVGSAAFSGSKKLSSVNWSLNAKIIRDKTFSGCTSLKNIDFINGVQGIGEAAFSECSGLRKIVIPESVNTIELYAFLNCINLEEIVIPSDIKINGNPFLNCSKLVSVVDSDLNQIFDNGFIIIGGSIIAYFGNNTDIIVPDTICDEDVYEIGAGAFLGSKIISITLPKNVSTINKKAFYGCIDLKNVKLNDNLISIFDEAFAFSGVENIILPDSVESISTNAFLCCTSLRLAVISENVTKIGDGAFDDCPFVTIKTKADSAAERYANDNYIPIIYL